MCLIFRRNFLLLMLYIVVGLLGQSPCAASAPNTVVIGTTSSSLSPLESEAVHRTFIYLSKKLPQYQFIIRTYRVSELEIAVKQGELDFFLASSGFYRRVYHRGLRDLVTLTTPYAEDPNYGSGSVFLVRRDSPIQTLEDLKGKTAAVSWKEGFTGYFIPLLTIAEAGFEPESFFKTTVVGGSPMRRLLEAVDENRADVALARACTLEELKLKDPGFAEKFRAVGTIDTKVSGFHCLRSTPLFPNWTIVSTSRAPWQVSRDITMTLLSMPKLDIGTSWAVVSDFAKVDDLYRTLKAGPFSYLRIHTASDFIKKYWPGFFIVALILLGLILHSWRTSQLIRQTKRELRSSMVKERLAYAAAQEEKRQKEILEQVSIIGAMSSLITHELNAPLNAINNCLRTLERFYEKDPPSPLVLKTIQLIQRQCDHAADIVQHVRSYAKRREIIRKKVDLAEVVLSIVKNQQIKHPTISLNIQKTGDVFYVHADPLELELCISNLVKNAIEAEQNTEIKKVDLRLTETSSHVIIRIRDYGSGTAETAGKLFSRSLQSTKTQGLGLGLMIVRTIVERSAGSIEAQWSDPGLTLILKFPKFIIGSSYEA